MLLDPSFLLPTPDALFVLAVTVDDGMIGCRVDSVLLDSPCPCCGVVASRVHSRYRRQLADLPWGNHAVRLDLGVRRFFCDERVCEQRIFAERLPNLAATSARRTLRLEAVFRLFGLALGGQAGARLAARIHAKTSPDAVLRLVLATPKPGKGAGPRVLGVDDWAWRKGHHYGTVLVDLERRQVLDLLPDRTADSLAAWLKAHPGVEVIARDRAGAYADGARRGAPQAIQVADRFHLLRNLRDAMQRLVEQRWTPIRLALVDGQPKEPIVATSAADVDNDEQGPTRAARETAARRERRLDRYRQVIELAAAGRGEEAIAATVGISPKTIRRYLSIGSFPEQQPRHLGSDLLKPHLKHLEERWSSGEQDGPRLYMELRALGFAGAKRTLERWMAKRRVATATIPVGSAAKPAPAKPTLRGVVWRLLRPAKDNEPESRTLMRVLAACPELVSARVLALEFFALLKERQPHRLAPWLEAAATSDHKELRTLASGLERDRAAVEAACAMEWSTGQVEGQNHRLKLIKRQGYGRAGFELLRQRVIHKG